MILQRLMELYSDLMVLLPSSGTVTDCGDALLLPMISNEDDDDEEEEGKEGEDNETRSDDGNDDDLPPLLLNTFNFNDWEDEEEENTDS